MLLTSCLHVPPQQRLQLVVGREVVLLAAYVLLVGVLLVARGRYFIDGIKLCLVQNS